MEDRVAGAGGRRRGGRVRVGGGTPLKHVAHAPYTRWLTSDGGPDCAIAALNGHAIEEGIIVRFEAAGASICALDYERKIAGIRIVPLREASTHDGWNALAWLRFPRTKTALNALHVAEADARTANGRSAWRDRATLIDESGLLVTCRNEALLAHWSRHEWRAAFSQGRASLAKRIGAIAIGHGLLDKLGAPYRSLTAHALVLPLAADASIAEVDATAACAIDARDFTLRPVPVAALPGWDSEALGDALFDDNRVFRPARSDFRQRRTA